MEPRVSISRKNVCDALTALDGHSELPECSEFPAGKAEGTPRHDPRRRRTLHRYRRGVHPGRLLKTQLSEISPNDPATYIAVPIVLILVSALAAFLPALRATRVDSAVALRYE
jgi:hypothetical protein